MSSLTPTSFYDYDSTPFMQGYKTNKLSFADVDTNGGFGLNKIKYQQNDNIIPKGSYYPNRSLYAPYSRSAALYYDPTQSDVMPDQPRSFNVQAATQAIKDTLPAMMPGDGAVGDATAIEQANTVVDHMHTIANAKDPDAVAASLMNQPGYESGSFMGGLMNMGLAIMSGADPEHAAQAGIKGQEYFDDKARKEQMSDYLRQNAKDLLDQGYSANSISAAIANGDNSLLKMRQLSPSEIQAQKDKDNQDANKEWDRRTAIEQGNKMEALNTKSADQRSLEAMRAQDKADAKKAIADAAKQDAEAQPFSTLPKGRSGNNAQMTALNKRYDKNVTNWRMADQAYTSLQGLENADDRTQLATMQAEGDRLARSLLGGNATLTPEQIKEITGSPMSMDQFADWFSTNTDQGRAKRAIKYMAQVAKASRDGYSYTIRNDVSKDRENMKRYNNDDPHKTTQDIMTVAGVDPSMFMRPDELEEYQNTGRWIKKGGIHEKYGDGALHRDEKPQVKSGSSLLDAAMSE